MPIIVTTPFTTDPLDVTSVGHHWKMDVASGTPVDSVGGAAFNLNVNLDHTYSLPGVPGISPSLSIRADHQSSTLWKTHAGFPAKNTDWTCELFAKWTYGAARRTIFIFGTVVSSPQCRIFVNELSAGDLGLWSNGVQRFISTSSLLNDGAWHHICVTHKHNGVDDNDLNWYIDGTNDGTVLGMADNTVSGSPDVNVGRNRNSNIGVNLTAPGIQFDDVRIHTEVVAGSYISARAALRL